MLQATSIKSLQEPIAPSCKVKVAAVGDKAVTAAGVTATLKSATLSPSFSWLETAPSLAITEIVYDPVGVEAPV